MKLISDKLSSEQILPLFNNAQIENGWSFAEYKPSETSKWTHGYHRYPAKFIPQLVEKLFDEYIHIPDAVINDPFMGCGTTIVTGISRGFKTSGTDINKIAYLIAKVKSNPIEPEYLSMKIEELLAKFILLHENQLNTFKKVEPLIPEKHLERIDYWFTKEIKIQLGQMLQIIEKEKDIKIREFFRVSFSHILKSCSIWMQGSTKPTRDLKKIPANPYIAIKRHLTKMQRGNDIFYKTVPSKTFENINEYLNIANDDARKQPAKDATVDIIVTSSPYVTSYEYADLHQLSTLWLNLSDDLTEYKQEFIGTSLKKYNEKKLKSNIARTIVSQMSQNSAKMAKEIEAFFIDMQEVIDESFRILKYGGRCCYVIGNTRLKNVDILNAEVFAESMQHAGFIIDRIIKREIPSKILPQKRDEKTGRFASNAAANAEAYSTEYIVIGLKNRSDTKQADARKLPLEDSNADFVFTN